MVTSAPRRGSNAGPDATPTPPTSGLDVPAIKLGLPAMPRSPVLRTQILELIARAGSVRLITIRAPAGFGKTTAMLQIREHLALQGVETAWLTLDRADNDATRFLGSFSAAVRSLSCDAQPHGTALEAVETLASRTAPFALFLDDFEAIEESAIFSILRTTIERLPRGGQVIVGSRSLPDLGLARLRVHGQLLELDADALRFDLAETREYLRLRLEAALSSDATDRLHRKTEGWIAALWLASITLERQGADSDFIERFSGSNRAVAEFLADDVLAHQPAPVREFLLRTSILRHLDASVCQALVPDAQAGQILRTLEEKNLFLVALAGEERTYRYHGLFADYLRQRLQLDHPEEVERLHLSASRWYESHNRPVPAIDHAIEGGDVGHAMSLLERHAQRFLEQGRMRLLERWFTALPEQDLKASPVLRAVSIWASLFTRGPWEAANALESSGLATSEDPVVRAHVNAQGPLLLAMQDRYDEAYALGKASLRRLPTCNAFADSVLRNAMANVFSVMGETQESQRMIDDSRRAQGDSTFNRMYAESQEGLLDLQAGRLRQATARFRLAVSATLANSYDYTSGNAWAGVLYASALYEANDFDGAEHLVNVYLPLACDVGLPGHMIGGHMIRARIAFYRGDISKAFDTLTALEYLGYQRQLRRIVASAKLERGRLFLLQGNAQASREELDRADDPTVWEHVQRRRLPAHDVDYLALARIRWQIHFGDARTTLPLLEREIAEATAQSRHRRALRVRVLKSLALQRSGEPAAATETLATVLRQASREGFVRLIVDEGEAVARLLHRFKAVLLEMPAKRSDPILIEHLQRLTGIIGPDSDADSIPGDDRLMEPLTRKEIQVLQLGGEGYSNAAMAEKLGLSDSTVRTHLRSINAKLNAHSRAEAVAIGRRMGVIR